MKTTRFFSILLLFSLLTTTISAQMSADQLKKLTKESFEAMMNHDLDKFGTYMADNAVDYGQGPEPVKGRMAIVEGLKGFFGAFPDYKVTLEDIAISGNRAYIKNNFKATHTMTLMGMIPATGKKVDWSDTDIVEFDNWGKITGHWANNPYGPLYQIGYGSLTNPNTAIVMAAYSEFSKANIPGILALCTNDIVFDITDRVFLPDGKVYKGTTEVPEFFKFLSSKVQFTKFEPYRFLADGDDVIVLINGEYKDVKTGKMYSAQIVHQFKLVNGKIMWLKGTTDKPMDMMAMSAKK
jgi:ketosteroid isomerase-like protein